MPVLMDLGWILDGSLVGLEDLLGELFGHFNLLKNDVSCTRNTHFGGPEPPQINKIIDQL